MQWRAFFNHCKISRMRIKISDSSLNMTTSCFFSEHVQKGEQVILFENAEPSAWIRDCTPLWWNENCRPSSLSYTGQKESEIGCVMIDNRSTDKRFGRCYLTILKSALLSKIKIILMKFMSSNTYMLLCFILNVFFFLTYVYYIFNYLDTNNQVLYL